MPLTISWIHTRIEAYPLFLNSHKKMTTRKPASPRKMPRQGRSQAMVQALLEASARVLKERGYEGMSTNAVAECAGVSVGSLYQYFPNKVALLAALHAEHAANMEESIKAVLAIPSVDKHASIKNLVRAIMAAHELDPALHRLLEKERPFFEENTERLGMEIHKEVCAFLTRFSDEGSLNISLIAWITMRMLESLIHAAIIKPPLEQNSQDVEKAIVIAICSFIDSAFLFSKV